MCSAGSTYFIRKKIKKYLIWSAAISTLILIGEILILLIEEREMAYFYIGEWLIIDTGIIGASFILSLEEENFIFKEKLWIFWVGSLIIGAIVTLFTMIFFKGIKLFFYWLIF
jgi:hypothetical protein